MPCIYDLDLCDENDGAVRIALHHREDAYVDEVEAWLLEYGEGLFAPIVTQELDDGSLVYTELVFTDRDTALAFKVRFY
jgi:hypothetical protein